MVKQETQIMFKCSEEEKRLIKDYSKSISLSVSAFCRSCAIKEARQILLNNNIKV